jgi:hypothetical protein
MGGGGSTLIIFGVGMGALGEYLFPWCSAPGHSRMDTFPMLKPRSRHRSSKRKQRQGKLASGAEESLSLAEHCRGNTDAHHYRGDHPCHGLSQQRKEPTGECIVAGAIPLFSIIVWYVEVMWVALLFLLLFSPGYGGGLLLTGTTLREYFKRDSFGTLLGITMGSASIGGIIGPTFAGWGIDTVGD